MANQWKEGMKDPRCQARVFSGGQKGQQCRHIGTWKVKWDDLEVNLCARHMPSPPRRRRFRVIKLSAV